MYVLIGAWALLLAVLLAALVWLTRQPVMPPPARPEPPDPYRDEVERFRRQVADWDGQR